ncbi:MAG TPA: serine protease [Chitinophagaceae bacterium]|nr:serine protease [Chitinophagaceae bacterium]
MPDNHPYEWTIKHTQLNDALAALIPFPNDIFPHIKNAGIDIARVWADGISGYQLWRSSINFAITNKTVPRLIETVRQSFPNDPFLLTISKAETIDYTLGPTIDKNIPWKGEDRSTLEVLTQPGLNTMQPISFLEKGLLRAKPVAKVQYQVQGIKKVGSGFLIADNIFITNHHVLPDAETATKAQILFNYENDLNDIPKNVTPFEIDTRYFITSPVAEYDTTAFRLKGDANKDFDALPFDDPEFPAQKNDFVNIIQHPAGQHKQIALYHNIVTNTDERVVQYLTDTLQGSSGSPVFNSYWEVVALHHSGGYAAKDADIRSIAFKNEGISIRHVINLIRQAKKQGKL